MQPQQNKSHRTSRILLFLLLALLAVGVAQREQIQDYIRLLGYSPPAAVAALATETTMTPKAEHLFFVNRPGLFSQVEAFRKACPENAEIIVLGCYIGVENGINIYQINDPALTGVQQTTAAHEMLHAAYDRLNTKTKNSVNGMLQNFYDEGLADTSVKAELEIYKTSEPDQLLNEMHSLFGTEVAVLPPELEDYYKQYFTNRPKVTAYYAQYQAQFSQRQQTLKDDDALLARQKTEIDNLQAILQQRKAKISSDRNRINSYSANNDVASYNAAVPGYNAGVNNYNVLVQQLSNTIDAYNELVARRNDVANQLAALDKSLDTRTAQAVKP